MFRNSAILTRSGPMERWLPIAGIAAAVGALALFASGWGHLIPPCLLREFTGTLCPGCGSGRVARAFLALDLSAAWKANPLVVLALPPTAYGLVREALLSWGVARLPWPRLRPWWGWALLVGVLAFWALRNVDFWPFVLLAPR